MSDQGPMKNEDIFSKVIRAGRRTYFFDVRSTKADDYYLTITESKKFTNEDGSFYYRKHKIYLYKEDFENFKDALEEATNFIIDKKGEEVISDKHQKDFTKPSEMETSGSIHTEEPAAKTSAAAFTNISFDDI